MILKMRAKIAAFYRHQGSSEGLEEQESESYLDWTESVFEDVLSSRREIVGTRRERTIPKL